MKKRIYLKHLGNKKLEITPDEFTKKLFEGLNDNQTNLDDTFRDPEFKKIECDGYKRRSIDDLLLIYRTYLPGIHASTILKSIERVVLIPGCGNLLFCDNIQKWVLYDKFKYEDEEYESRYLYTHNYQDSNGEYENIGKGKLSLKKILTLMGHEDHLAE